MAVRVKWLWIVTTANTIVAILLVMTIYAMMRALAALASEIPGWPLFVLLALGFPLSITGLWLARGRASRLRHRAANTLNGCALTFNVLLMVGLVALYVSSTEERFLIPEGHQGDVHVIYSVPNGEPVRATRWAVTYRIPEDGILRTRGAMIRGWTRREYYYVGKGGTLERIPNSWCCWIDPTPENLANDRDTGVFFPRSGRFSDASGCSVEYDLFYVGTKAHLLTTHSTNYKAVDLGGYLHAHPGACSSGQSNHGDSRSSASTGGKVFVKPARSTATPKP